MARSLQTYRAKRNFKASPEPDAPEVKHKRDTKQPPALKFVVQCHSARRLHYDFRLEFAGVLLSWAVTRGPSANPATRRLAVRTEDHPLDYAGFEGVIPKGSYGAGPVMIWDRGTWTAAGDAGRGLAEGHLKVVLAGERMRGLWALVRLKDDGSRENWLLIKDRDAFAEADDALTERFTDSVVSSRGFPDIAAGKPAKSPKPAVWPPRFVPCMLCETVKTAPEGNDWQFEMKYDGYRLQLALGEASAVLRTRNGLDWTDRFPDVANAARSMKLADSILDGEAVILNAAGISDYPALVAALGRGGAGIGFVVFDVLRDRGKDLRSLSLAQRRRALEKLFAKYGPKTDVIRLAPALTGDGKLLLERIVAAGGEGLIAKRTTSTYQSRRSSSWLKIKGVQRIEATVIGWMPSPAGRKFASLLLAVPTQDGLRYAGRVGSGFGGQTESDAFDRLERIERKTPPRDIQGLELPSGVHWVAPRLVAEIGFGGFTGEGRLRAARFVRWKTAAPGPKPEVAGGTMRPAKSLASSDAGPVTITHPARVVFPQISFTKDIRQNK